MPHARARRSRYPSVDSSDDGAADGTLILPDTSSSPSAPKRPRTTNTIGTPRPPARSADNSNRSPNDGDGDDDLALSPVDVSAYQPGSIIRIRMSNFVTYTSAEFVLGPSLNMVIGPNGTGKSTLVCAICLGLGWGPKNLGRAKELGEFVKHGESEATIEITLKGGHVGEPGDGPDPSQLRPDLDPDQDVTITRLIKKQGNKSSWMVNGQPSSNSRVLALARSFSIQIDNLCQFLPQDRVVEFAQLHPVEMLASTQRAAAPAEMVDMFETLKGLKEKEKAETVLYSTNNKELKSLQHRQNQLRADVERMEERQNLKDKISLYEKFKPLISYKDIRIKDAKAKAELNKARAEYGELERQVEPSLASLRQWQTKVAELERIRTSRRDRLSRAQAETSGYHHAKKKLTDELDEIDTNKRAEAQSIKSRRADLEKIRDRIRHLQDEHASTRPDYDPRRFQPLLQEARDRRRQAEKELAQIDTDLADISRRAEPKRPEMEALKRQIASLESQAGQQMQKLQRASRDSAVAWEWLKKNRSRFKGEVYGPPMVECTVGDLRYADIVEATMSRNDLLMFSFTDEDDLVRFRDAVYGDELRLSDVTVRTVVRPLDHYRAPFGLDELRARYGLDGWILDLLSGPDTVLAALCDSCRIHRTGYTTRQDVAPEQSQLLLNSDTLNTWVTASNVNVVNRRAEYGPQAVSTQTRPVRKAVCWTDSVDHTAGDALNRRLETLKAEFIELQDLHRAKKQEKESVNQQLREAQVEFDRIMREKEKMQSVYSNWKAIPPRIDNLREKEKAAEESMSASRQALVQLGAKKDIVNVQLAKHAIELTKKCLLMQKPYLELVEAETWFYEARSQEETLRQATEQVTAMLATRKEDVAAKEAEHKRIRAEARQLVTQATEINAQLTPDERLVHRELNEQETTLEMLEADILSMQTRLGLLHEGNPAALAQFEKRRAEIERLTADVAASEEKLARLRRKISSVRAVWEPELDELVGRISDAFGDNFARIGCAGQVTVHKVGTGPAGGEEDGGGPAPAGAPPAEPERDDGDFARWEIRIHVKFREHEQLSVLDSHRQSGGERSVSTIFYLMALQSLARSPFRVVDEINQGMDPRNERTVHERMVEIACGRSGPAAEEEEEEEERTSQYFLVTPKLLTGLKYHPRMKVHVINSGESVPDDIHEMDLSAVVNAALSGHPVAA